MKKALGMSLLMLVALGCLFSPVSAQDRWEVQVRKQLRAHALVISDIADVDIEEAYAPFIQSLKRNQSQDITYRLVEGVTYVLTGACDEDCQDLDFKLFSDSTKIREDVASDDRPTIIFTPAWTGTYTLRVIMVNCTREPCRYGVGAFK